MQRRNFLHSALALTLAAGAAPFAGVLAAGRASGRDAGDPGTDRATALRERLAAIEQRSGGRLGVAVLDTADGRHWSMRGDERFGMCSTYKLPLVAAVLHKAELGQIDLNARIAVPAAALVPNSPATAALARSGGSASVARLCEASLTVSDNTAANLLLPLVGDPAGLNGFLRGLGDPVTQVERTPGAPLPGGDARDVTTPDAMLATMRAVLLGDALNAASRQRLSDWLLAATTGPRRLRAGLPQGWRVGHKTGTSRDSANDIAIVWPGRRAPVLIAGYFTGARGDDASRDAVLADAARALATHWIGAA
ncbi:beta-lactamase class A [Lysobacter sp. yr284]|uniref:class A beta-lactamase n=1 Tax=Lysobacter sp. yr284 TaxID=1761791 RepID=UPI000894216A|nr:class A beta-lactamase [Lysobacter sp. yr284]SDZ01986.1 beta-lactamase class A [Lysobacter sp. yr284]